jgi:hypothetical protein
LVSAISIAERDEEPEGIADVSVARRRFRGTNMAQRGAEKSQLRSDWGGKGNFGVKPGLGLCVFHKFLPPEAVNGIFACRLGISKRWPGSRCRCRS